MHHSPAGSEPSSQSLWLRVGVPAMDGSIASGVIVASPFPQLHLTGPRHAPLFVFDTQP